MFGKIREIRESPDCAYMSNWEFFACIRDEIMTGIAIIATVFLYIATAQYVYVETNILGVIGLFPFLSLFDGICTWISFFLIMLFSPTVWGVVVKFLLFLYGTNALFGLLE